MLGLGFKNSVSKQNVNVVCNVELPIHAYQKELIDSIDKYATTIVVGETGSGINKKI